ncbi:hypothetical protein SAMN05444143_1038 [Flavobacterium succinicans]|jgi:hypothetical protein|uniref:DUF1735 domain-containing protein n=1 Tax=Flavobacterium succinicans TaxID=29536 RepID=A0A1I4U5V7_9FLAO|nr:hypothetical protein [Flavobacterium succinicans]SFM84382.1 hypothetical protein SAMN05444143_1038 [Flavobacterium succinicans]
MKRIITLIAVIGMIAFSGCSSDDDFDSDTIGEVFELRNVNFDFNATDGYNIYQKLSPQIFPSDVILVYRLTGTVNGSTPIWQSIPRTLYTSQGELDYDFDFSREDFTIYAGGNYNLALTPEFLRNQTFRIVIVPAAFSRNLNSNDYFSVIKALNLNDGKVKQIQL